MSKRHQESDHHKIAIFSDKEPFLGAALESPPSSPWSVRCFCAAVLIRVVCRNRWGFAPCKVSRQLLNAPEQA
jgi:hypothetical protein